MTDKTKTYKIGDENVQASEICRSCGGLLHSLNVPLADSTILNALPVNNIPLMIIPLLIEESVFCLDDGPSYRGIHNNNYRWNGWIAPFFTLDVLKEIIIDVNAGTAWLQFKEENGKPFLKEDEEDGWYELAAIEHKGGVYFGIDAWCWSLDKDYDPE